MVERIRDILALLDIATESFQLDRPDLKLHPLNGDLRGFWAVTVHATWRIDFFDDHQEGASTTPTKNPPYPGRLLRADIEALGLSVAEAANGLGVRRRQLYNVPNGKSAISPETAVRLEQGIGTRPKPG